MEQERKVRLRDGRVVTVRGPITRIPPADVECESLIIPLDYSGGRHAGTEPDPDDDPPNTNTEIANPTATEEVYRHVELGVLHEAMNTRLSGVERTVLRIHSEGYTFTEVATILKMNPDAVKKASSRALAKIGKIARN